MITLERGEAIELYGDRIAIRPLPCCVAATVSGLVLPDTSKRTPVRGEVVAVGTLSRLNVGDTIVFRPRVGTDYELGGQPYQIMGDRDVITVIST